MLIPFTLRLDYQMVTDERFLFEEVYIDLMRLINKQYQNKI